MSAGVTTPEELKMDWCIQEDEGRAAEFQSRIDATQRHQQRTCQTSITTSQAAPANEHRGGVRTKTEDGTFLVSENRERPSGRPPISTCPRDTFLALPCGPVESIGGLVAIRDV